MEKYIEIINNFLETTGVMLVQVFAILVFGIIIIKVLMKFLRKALLKSSVENTLGSFVLSILNLVLYIVLVFIVADVVGISTTSFIAALSAIALAISLALQSSLSNLANGLIIVGTKPFVEGDFVEIASITGKIKSISMFNTKIVTLDNKVITVPNSEIVNSNVINHFERSTRRVDLTFSVAYGSDIKVVKRVIMGVIAKHKMILQAPEPFVRLMQQNSSSLDFVVRVWTSTVNYWDVYFDLNEQIYDAFNRSGLEIPFNQIDVHIKNDAEKTSKKKNDVVLSVIENQALEEVRTIPVQDKPVGKPASLDTESKPKVKKVATKTEKVVAEVKPKVVKAKKVNSEEVKK